MKTQTLVGGAVLGLLAVALCGRTPAADSKSRPQAAPYTLSGPYNFDNLTIYLIHGQDQLKGKTFLTLDEALDQKKLIVHETKNVNQLAVENVDPQVEVIILSGDIVKGGQQDRTIAYDQVVPPKSGKVPVASFCVEQGRWRQRGQESAVQFTAARANLPSKDAKIAVKGGARSGQAIGGRARQGGGVASAQGKVWNEVARKQMMLARVLGKSVKSMKSETSLQLTLEDKKLLQAVDVYSKKLTGIIDGKKDVIGYAFAINGQMNSADVYASHELFKKLWPKLLTATVVEAIAEIKKDKKFEPVKAEVVKAFMADAEKGKESRTDVSKRIRLVTQESKKNFLYCTQDQKHPGAALRKNYIAK